MIERIILFLALMQVLDVYTYIFEIFKIYFVKNSKILVLINFSQRTENCRKHRKNSCVDKSLTKSKCNALLTQHENNVI